ncbi:uncharacterized protein [Chelonus insularis]|uniref:uncharacterized protein isoform X2 n=1 Tax=Chelonus insularis TaxID=460826 RepID=UPI00158C52BA|nr:uncharacterized protein LOC118068674 isoform X2 [Chelonus insularis]
MMFIDRETGESLEDTFIERPPTIDNLNANNAETGEPEIIFMRSSERRVPFQIPKEFKKNFAAEDDIKFIDKNRRNMVCSYPDSIRSHYSSLDSC